MSAAALGEIAIFKGCADEMKSKDGQMKINVWMTGLNLTRAMICLKTEKPDLAKLYASCVLAIDDKTGTLNARKEQAKKIIEEVDKS